MKLTVKNVAEELLNNHQECPFCGGEAEICGWQDDGGTHLKLFCDGCGGKADFLEFLIELENRDAANQGVDQ